MGTTTAREQGEPFMLGRKQETWKSESAKECVTTHLPNQLALKMDEAEALYPYPAVGPSGMV